jgi:hypothetical protein
VETLRKIFQLSPREVWLLAQAAVLLPAVRLALPFTGVGRLTDARVAADRGSTTELVPGNHEPDEVRSVTLVESRFAAANSTARMVRIAAWRGLYRAKCLEQSLVLRWLLRRQSIDAQVVFGARKNDERMQAHAWVECQGVRLEETGDVWERFAPIEAATAQTE